MCHLGALTFYVGVFLITGTTLGQADETYLSPETLIANKEKGIVYVAAAGGERVIALRLLHSDIGELCALPGPPGGLAISPDGAHLYVTVRVPAGKVCVVDIASGAIEETLPVGHTPVAPVLSPDGNTLYVCNRFDDTVSVVDLASKQEVAVIPVSREPVAAALSPDGACLLVANHLPAGAADGQYVAAIITVIDTGSRAVAATIPLPNGSTGLRGICTAPDGRYAYVTHILGRYRLPTTQLERGWMNTNALSIINLATRSLVNTVLLDDVDAGAANPWGVACTQDGRFLCVTHAGTREISVIDRAALHDKLAKAAAGERVSEVTTSSEDVPNDLSFLVGIRRRVKLTGNGPRGLVLVGTRAYVAEYFTDSIGVVELDPGARDPVRSVALEPPRPQTAERRGEMLFNDAIHCFQQWQSCASCHPDVRADGLNWDLLNDGMGNPKNTKSLLLVHQTPPAMARGGRGTAEAAVRAGIRVVEFAVLPEEDAAAMDAYLKSVQATPSPYLADGKPNPSAQRGAQIFEKAGCAGCHPAPLYTNLGQFGVGTGTGSEEDLPLDTPTLVEVWRTAPYLHDGRAVTIKDVLTKDNPADKHGVTSRLTETEIKDLAAFVLSL